MTLTCTSLAVLIGLLGSAEVAEADALADTCSTIESLIDSDPAEALALIDQVRSPAADLVRSGEQIPAGVAPLLSACETQRISAIETLGASRLDEQSLPSSIGANWSRFSSEWLAPLGTMTLVTAAAVAALLIGARFASLLPGVRRGLRNKLARILAGSIGPCAIVAGCVGAVIAMANVGNLSANNGNEWFAVGAWVLLAGLGAILLGLALAGRLKITLDVRGADGKRDAWASARAAGVLSEMGGAPARGIDKPEGSDLEALSSALPEFGGTSWSGLVRAVMKFLFVGTPWRASVDTDFDRFAVVAIYRNGAPVVLQRIDLPDTPTPDDPVHTIDAYAAAIIVIALSKVHEGFEGLSGATNWASVGQYFLASRYDEHDPRFRRLARAAVQKDPRNYLARFGLNNAEAVTGDEFGSWLRSELKAIGTLPRGRQPLEVELRARRALGNEEIQLHSEGLMTGSTAIAAMADNILALVNGLNQPDERQTVLHHLLRSDAAILVRDLQAIASDPQLQGRLEVAADATQNWFSDAEASLYPDVAYNLACHYAVQGRTDAAIRHLRVAMLDAELKAEARKDKEFNRLRNESEFSDLVNDDPRSSFWEVDYFKPVASKLQECGVREPGDLTLIGNPGKVRKYIGWPSAPFETLKSACDLVRRARLAASGTMVEELQVELIDAMFHHGIFGVDQVPATWLHGDASDEFATIVRNARERCGSNLPVKDARRWLDEVANS